MQGLKGHDTNLLKLLTTLSLSQVSLLSMQHSRPFIVCSAAYSLSIPKHLRFFMPISTWIVKKKKSSLTLLESPELSAKLGTPFTSRAFPSLTLSGELKNLYTALPAECHMAFTCSNTPLYKCEHSHS